MDPSTDASSPWPHLGGCGFLLRQSAQPFGPRHAHSSDSHDTIRKPIWCLMDCASLWSL